MIEDTIEKTAVRTIHGNKVVQLSYVGQVTTRLATDKDLFTGTLGLFQEKHIGT